MDGSVASLSMGDEVKPYKIHVSSKYLEITQKKLELTRLPHELLLPRARDWEYGTPKSEIEPLIDFWLEQYSWRVQESHLNSTLPQYRTAIIEPGSNVPLRIHFVHIRSPHAHAVPLLLIPTFPLTNLSLTPLYAPLADPPSLSSTQPFHIVIPSIPGLGFSDAFTSNISLLSSTAELFNTLMLRLSYPAYIASSTGPGFESPADIDYHLARLVGENFPDSCLGVHLISPPLQAPSFIKEPWVWMKFAIASFFHAPIFGYSAADFTALAESRRVAKSRRISQESETNLPLGSLTGQFKKVWRYGGVGMLGLREPNTLAYALCDSPVGLLSLVCSGLNRVSPTHKLSNTEIIDLTQIAWLPGPEAATRFWASAMQELENLEARKGPRSKVAVTVFGSDGQNGGYICPAWAASKHNVVFAQRVLGKGGLVAWERTDVVVEGIRGLASEVSKRDNRLNIRELEEVVIIIEDDTILEEDESESKSAYEMQLEVESPDTIVAFSGVEVEKNNGGVVVYE